ncbi:hypothetical protein H650_18515 [Enterobacter sp. R4-368]|nr:hypothetical protein H650_18515 [Enterobacter sp. R4-368]
MPPQQQRMPVQSIKARKDTIRLREHPFILHQLKVGIEQQDIVPPLPLRFAQYHAMCL